MSKPKHLKEAADKLRMKIGQQTADTLNIPLEEALKRVDAFQKSGITGNPDSLEYMMKVDAFMAIPSSTYEHLK